MSSASSSSWPAPLANFLGLGCSITRGSKPTARHRNTSPPRARRPSPVARYGEEHRAPAARAPAAREQYRQPAVRESVPPPHVAVQQVTCAATPSLPGRAADHPTEIAKADHPGRYAIHAKAGKGAYGCVYTGEDVATGEAVALKCITDIFRSTEDAKRALREAAILRRCDHPNIIGYRNTLSPPNTDDFNQLWIVLEKCDWDLRSVLQMKMRAWTNTHVEHLLHQTLCGLAYLHENGIVHRDLKPANILVTRSCEVRIADFGLSRQIQQAEDDEQSSGVQRDSVQQLTPPKALHVPSGLARTLSRRVVTRYYRAPELLLGSDAYDAAIDIWSVGCILAEMLHSLAPSSADSDSTTASPPLPVHAVLFPGESGDEYPSARTLPSELRKSRSMLRLQFNTLGLPNRDDIDVLTDESDMRRALDRYCGRMEEQEEALLGRVDERSAIERLQERYPHAPPASIQLLAATLSYAPSKRPRAVDLTCNGPKHSFADMLRPSSSSSPPPTPPSRANCPEMTFPFENTQQDRRSLRRLILEEANADSQAAAAAAAAAPVAAAVTASTASSNAATASASSEEYSPSIFNDSSSESDDTSEEDEMEARHFRQQRQRHRQQHQQARRPRMRTRTRASRATTTTRTTQGYRAVALGASPPSSPPRQRSALRGGC
eukprot:COSAG06_NODE_1582_length_9017_cov_11.406593_8_plen_663_part_00